MVAIECDDGPIAVRRAVESTWEVTEYGSLLSQGRRGKFLRRLLRDRRRGAGHRGAAHVARLRLVVAPHAVHGLAVVPHHEIMHRPFVDVDEFRTRGVLGEIA